MSRRATLEQVTGWPVAIRVSGRDREGHRRARGARRFDSDRARDGHDRVRVLGGGGVEQCDRDRIDGARRAVRDRGCCGSAPDPPWREASRRWRPTRGRCRRRTSSWRPRARCSRGRAPAHTGLHSLVCSPSSRRIGATLPETPAWKVSTAPASGFTESLFATMISSRTRSMTTVNGSASVVSGPVMTRFAGVLPVAEPIEEKDGGVRIQTGLVGVVGGDDDLFVLVIDGDADRRRDAGGRSLNRTQRGRVAARREAVDRDRVRRPVVGHIHGAGDFVERDAAAADRGRSRGRPASGSARRCRRCTRSPNHPCCSPRTTRGCWKSRAGWGRSIRW